MTKLPTPGRDAGSWGDMLNDYLLTEHNANGQHNIATILGTPSEQGKVLISDRSLSKGVAWKSLAKEDVGLDNVTNDAQVKLCDLDTDGGLAANSHGKVATQRAVKAYVDTRISDVAAPLATSSTAGKIRLAGDIGGSSSSPLVKSRTVAKIVGTGDVIADYICDGINDHTEIQTACDAVAAGGGGIVHLREGRYSISNPIIVKDGVWLRGSGMRKTVLAGTSNVTTGILRGNGTSTNPVSDATVSDLMLDGTDLPASATTSNKGLNGQYWKRLQVRNVYCYNTPATGLGPDFLQDSAFTNCVTDSCGRLSGDPGYNGFGIGTGGFDTESLQFVNCYAYNCGDNGFLIEEQAINVFAKRDYQFQLTNCVAAGNKRGFHDSGTSGVTMTNCKAYNNSEDGFNLLRYGNRDTHDTTLIGCDAYGNTKNGIYYGTDNSANGESSRNAIIEGCHVHDNGKWGIFSGGSNRIKIVNNVVFSNGSDGIKYLLSDGLGTRSAVTITGNTVYSNGLAPSDGGTQHGIYVATTSDALDGLLVSGNIVYDDQATPTQKFGVYVNGLVQDCSITNNIFRDLAGTGIYVNMATAITAYGMKIMHNTVRSCGRAGLANQNDGIRLVSANASGYIDGVIIHANKCYDTRATKTQNYGVVLQSYIKNAQVYANDLRDNKTAAALSGADASCRFADNKGYNPHGYYNLGTVNGSPSINIVNGNTQIMTLGGNISPSLIGGVNVGDRLVLTFIQDATGSRTITFPSNFKKAGGNLVLSTTAGATDIITMHWDGADWIEASRALNVS